MAANSPPAPPGARRPMSCISTSTRSRTRPGPAASSTCSTAAGACRVSRRSSRASSSRMTRRPTKRKPTRNNARIESRNEKPPLARGFLFQQYSLRLDAFGTKSRLQQAELALDRIDGCDAVGRVIIVNGGVEPAHFALQLVRTLDQLAQRGGQ